ncbi:hypothetical protein L2E82_39183 [Cichorium intybus]|uniref:Uncharacterized protein n=1 Tax=Cichorium intybus TaxID=13427 RepID=A0ACB9AIT9_CICIN|nr:hypothetical protein L2E82_39183 [Cichorium intybus]
MDGGSPETPIGIVGFDEDWFPFIFDPTEILYEDEYGNDVILKDNCEGDETDGENNDETEEGEFVPKSPITTPQEEPEPVPMHVTGEKGTDELGKHVNETEKENKISEPVNLTLPLPEGELGTPMDAGEVEKSRNNLGRVDESQKEAMHCMGGTRNEDTSPPRKLAAIMTDKHVPTPLIPTVSTPFNCGSEKAAGSDPSTPIGFGDLNGLPPGCFGPFTSTPKLNLSPNFIPSMPNLSNLDSPLRIVEGTTPPTEGTNPNCIDPGETTNIPLSEADMTVEIGVAEDLRKMEIDIAERNPFIVCFAIGESIIFFPIDDHQNSNSIKSVKKRVGSSVWKPNFDVRLRL